MKHLFITTFSLLILLIPASIAFGQRPDAPDYAQRGAHPVGTREFVVEDETRPLAVTIWYPALNPDDVEETTTYDIAIYQLPGHAIRDADPDDSAAPYPVILFSHGNGGMRFQSAFLMEHLASYGFIVLATDHPTNTIIEQVTDEDFAANIPANYVYRPQDMARLYDFSESLNSNGDLAGLLNMDRLALSGHSFGGYTALASSGVPVNFTQFESLCDQLAATPEYYDGACFLTNDEVEMASTAGNDPDLTGAWPAFADLNPDALLLLAPWNGIILDTAALSQQLAPTLTIVGTADEITPPQRDAYFIYQQRASAPQTVVTLESAGHYVFVDECSDVAITLGFYERCLDPIWDMQRAHDITNHFAAAFLLSELYGDQEATAALRTQPGMRGITVFSQPGSLVARLQSTQRLIPDVIERIDHDTSAYTQGLLLLEGVFYESAGQYEESTLRRVKPDTGEVLDTVPVPPEYFAEGLARVDDRLIQLTWKEKTAFVYDLETLQVIDQFTYEGEGWGLCYDGTDLYMSNGTSEITRRDPETFETLEVFTVTANGYPIPKLNELECVGDQIYANVYQTDYIVRFDKHTGEIDAYIDATNLRLPSEFSGDVLNGIAYDAENDLFYLTGKYWPKMYLVRLIPD